MKDFLWRLLLCVALAGPAAAETNLAGTWQGKLEAAPGQTLTVQFVITAAPGGGYSTVVTSPDSGAIKNVRAASVKFADNRLTLDVPALSGGYVGSLRNGVLEGEWSQQGRKLPLSLRPYETPTRAQADTMLRGEWFGKLNNAGITVTIVLRFSTTDSGALRAALDVPEQGARDLASDVTLDAGRVSVKVSRASAEITGQLQGDQIVGQWNQLGNSLPLTLRKGRYVAAASYLDLPVAAREQLKGRWNGTLGPLPLSLRFETDAQGRTLGFLDSPKQNVQSIPITEAKLSGTTLTFGIGAIGAKYTGELAGSKLAGEWVQLGMPQPQPLAFVREQ